MKRTIKIMPTISRETFGKSLNIFCKDLAYIGWDCGGDGFFVPHRKLRRAGWQEYDYNFMVYNGGVDYTSIAIDCHTKWQCEKAINYFTNFNWESMVSMYGTTKDQDENNKS